MAWHEPVPEFFVNLQAVNGVLILLVKVVVALVIADKGKTAGLVLMGARFGYVPDWSSNVYSKV